MMKVLKCLGIISKYFAGMLCWLVILGVLESQCIFGISSVVDRLWMKDLHDSLAKNVIGEIAYHVHAGHCGDHYIYTAQYHPSRMDIEGERMRLTSLVDVATWRKAGSDSITVTYLDSKHKYQLYMLSDDDYIRAVNR